MSGAARSRQQLLATMVMMGIQRSPEPLTAEYLTTGVYVQELPSGIEPIPTN